MHAIGRFLPTCFERPATSSGVRGGIRELGILDQTVHPRSHVLAVFGDALSKEAFAREAGLLEDTGGGGVPLEGGAIEPDQVEGGEGVTGEGAQGTGGKAPIGRR